MAKINDSLKNYLSGSTSNSGTFPDSNTKGSGYFSWFNSSKQGSQPQLEPDTNGWFAQAQNDPLLPSLSKKQRVIGFIGCLLMGTFCFSLASLYIPFLVLKARKFAMLYTLGSLFIIGSFALLWGPVNHMKHLLSGERLPFTAAYIGTMMGTLYFSIWVKSTIFTVMCAGVQILALVWYVVSYIPGGHTGMKFFTTIFYSAASQTAKTASKVLPV